MVPPIASGTQYQGNMETTILIFHSVKQRRETIDVNRKFISTEHLYNPIKSNIIQFILVQDFRGV